MRFKTLNQKNIYGNLIGFSTEEKEGNAFDLNLKMDINYDAAKEIMQEEYFHLLENLNYAKAQFDEHNSIQIELKLRADVAKYLNNQKLNDGDVLDALQENEFENQALQIAIQNDSWYLLSMSQNIDLPDDLAKDGNALNIGFQTIYHSSFSPKVEAKEEENPINALTEVFEYFDLSSEKINDTAFRTTLEQNGNKWTSVAMYQADHNRFIVFSFFPHQIAEVNQLAVKESLNAWNNDLAIGAFLLNKKGQITLRTSMEFTDTKNYKEVFKTIFTRNTKTMNAYYQDLINLHAGVMP